MGIGLFVAGFVAAFVLSNYFYGGRSSRKPSAEAPGGTPVSEVPMVPETVGGAEREVKESPPEAVPPVPSITPAIASAPEEDKGVRLQRAFRSGKLSREAYEANLRKLGLAVPIDREEAPTVEVAPIPVSRPAAPVAPAPGDRADRLRRAFESGTLSREIYEANLRKMGIEHEATAAPGPLSAPPVDGAARIERLRTAYAAGRIPRADYEVMVRKLGAPGQETGSRADLYARAARLRDAYQAGRLSRLAYKENLRKLGIEPAGKEGTPMTSTTDPARDKAARLRVAYEAGRMSRELYERNLRALGLAPEAEQSVTTHTFAERIERLHQVYHAGRLSRELYEKNVRALGGRPMPEAPAPPQEEPTPHVTKAFEAAFEESRKTGEAPAPAVVNEPAREPPPPSDVRAEKIREAYASGRISRETYERNVRALESVDAVNPPVPTSNTAPPEPSALVPEAPVANPPPPAPSALPEGFEERVALIRSAFEEGRVTREIYERNLARTYEAVDPRLASLRRALAEGRITQPAYDAGVRRLLQGRGVS